MELSETQSRQKKLVIPYMAGVSGKLIMIFGRHHIPMHFKPTNTLRQRFVHPKDQTPKHNRSNILYTVQCKEECLELYVRETKQPLNRRMAQHRRVNASGQQSAVFLHLKDKGQSFDDQDVLILD